MFESIDFRPGEVAYDGFDRRILEGFDEESDLLTDDMLLVKYPFNYAIDIGWHGGLKTFLLYVTQNSDWDDPVEKRICSDLNSLKINLMECINNIRRLVDEEKILQDR
ncbi:hypothetical protein [Bacillus sp. UNC437CL72CviS29]|uniref:hypothetical protein n=1 Tax=Bacillus sp. UNC437CL72CviS29 TaxID=1340430 RepID=UPI00047DD0C5|nr:hypothetical protein [Bacillus sp. UNC437CL72CviS29]